VLVHGEHAVGLLGSIKLADNVMFGGWNHSLDC
jgi:hypothetical protein